MPPKEESQQLSVYPIAPLSSPIQVSGNWPSFFKGEPALSRHPPSRYTRTVHPVPVYESKIHEPAQLGAVIARLPRPLVFTNGVFDILHRGHASYLAQARALGASLLVAVNSDDSVRRLGKGPDRPINILADRVALLAALESVSAVTWFDDDTPLALIKLAKPDVLVKGGDWAPENMAGAAEVKSWSGAVVSIPFIHERSTSSTLAKIRAG